MPNRCDVCRSTAIVLTTKEVLNTRHTDGWPVIWFCMDCGAAVGTHEGTETPLGKMAGASVRLLRVQTHQAFDPIWREYYMSRRDAYLWISEKMGIPNLHIADLEIKQLLEVIAHSNKYIAAQKEKNDRINRRKAKVSSYFQSRRKNIR